MKNITETKVQSSCWEFKLSRRGITIISIKSQIEDMVDEWFVKNKIYTLNFKRRAWSTLKGVATKEVIRIIRNHFQMFTDAELSIKYDRKAGCSCGCSPGYVAHFMKGGEFLGQNMWMDIAMDKQAEDTVKLAINHADQKLKKELYQRNNPPVPEVTLNLS